VYEVPLRVDKNILTDHHNLFEPFLYPYGDKINLFGQLLMLVGKAFNFFILFLHEITLLKKTRKLLRLEHLVSISSTFYTQLLRAQIPKAQKTVKSPASSCTFETYELKSCA